MKRRMEVAAKAAKPESRVSVKDPGAFSTRKSSPKKTESDVTTPGKRPPKGSARERLRDKRI